MPERNHIRVCGMEIGMLIIEGNSVYEIDEECVRKRKVPEKCQTAQKLQMQRKRDAESGLEKRANARIIKMRSGKCRSLLESVCVFISSSRIRCRCRFRIRRSRREAG